MFIYLNANEYEITNGQFGHKKLLKNSITVLEPTDKKLAIEKIKQIEYAEVNKKIDIELLINN